MGLLTLINDILDLSKIEVGKLELHPAEFNLLAFLEGVAGIVRIRAREKGLAFSLDLSPELPRGYVPTRSACVRCSSTS